VLEGGGCPSCRRFGARIVGHAFAVVFETRRSRSFTPSPLPGGKCAKGLYEKVAEKVAEKLERQLIARSPWDARPQSATA
jgi:hypothetical protein